MAEDLVRNLIRVLGTVAVLAGVYFFMIKPILDTTEETFNRAFDAGDSITEQVFEGLEDAGVEKSKVKGLNLDPGDISTTTIDPTDVGALSSKEAERIFACMDAAATEVSKLTSCGELAQALSGN